jgi:hypothetical protein
VARLLTMAASMTSAGGKKVGAGRVQGMPVSWKCCKPGGDSRWSSCTCLCDDNLLP